MKFKAFLKQSGQGCDYTIACAQKVIDIVTDTKHKALQKLEKIIKEDYGPETLQALETVELYCIAEVVEVDVEMIYEEMRQKAQTDEEREKERMERAELARLQEKYNQHG